MKKYLFLIAVVIGPIEFAFASFLKSTAVGPGTIHHHEFIQNGPWHIHILESDLTNDWIYLKTVKANDLLSGYERTSSMAARNDFEEHRVVGAVNGDFYSTGGVPIGTQVLNGVLLKKPTTRAVFGYTNQKIPFIDIVSFQGAVVCKDGLNKAVNGINEPRDSAQLIVFNKYYGSSTGTNFWGTEVIAEYLTENQAVNDTILLYVTVKDSIMESGHGNNQIPANGVVISAHCTSRDFLNQNIFVGDTIKLILQLPPVTLPVVELIGGGPQIITNGVLSVDSSSFATDRHPRTAVGFSQDSTKIYFFTVDGRQPGYSVGMSLYELANYMLGWSVYQGVNLDGGGSTTMYVRNKVVNSPSDPGGERSVANALMLISTAPTSPLAELRITPEVVYLLSEDQFKFSVLGFDQYYNSVSVPEDSLIWSCDTAIGTIDSTGLFVAGSDIATGFIYVEKGAIRDSSVVHITEIASICLEPNPIFLKLGEQRIVTAEARDGYNNIIEVSSSEYEWSVTNDIGEISPEGVFTAEKLGGRGYIIATCRAVAGSTYVSIARSVGIIIEDFSSDPNWTLSGVFVNLAECNFGLSDSIFYSPPSSGQLDYSFIGDGAGELYLTCSIAISGEQISGTPVAIGIQVYGDGKRHWLRGEFQDKDDEKFTVNFTEEAAGIDWVNSWRYLTVPLQEAIPHWENPSATIDFPIEWTKIYLVEADESNENSGTIYLDDFTVYFVATGINEEQEQLDIPDIFQLESNYPNPFNNTTNFLITLRVSGDLFLIFYDVSGRKVETITVLDQSKGQKIVRWQPDGLPSGIYFYQIMMKNKVVGGKCLLIK